MDGVTHVGRCDVRGVTKDGQSSTRSNDPGQLWQSPGWVEPVERLRREDDVEATCIRLPVLEGNLLDHDITQSDKLRSRELS
jgi:hypothetical protein